ncbi:MAG: transcriptional regulator NrdR [Victivallaceae bacterium]|nr:transcriptional regulator NrdR [Victivallaceae bacterium]
MRCPKCGCQDDKVIDSRAVKDGSGVRRRRECTACQHRFTTYEGIIQSELRVVKRNGIPEDFDRDKLFRGISNACYKRPISDDEILKVVDEVTIRVQNEYDKEVPSSAIGAAVMDSLRKLDQVAYVRFASVYRKFKDVEEFIEEIRTLGEHQ